MHFCNGNAGESLRWERETQRQQLLVQEDHIPIELCIYAMAVTASLGDESDSGLRLLSRRHAPSGKRHRKLHMLSQADQFVIQEADRIGSKNLQATQSSSLSYSNVQLTVTFPTRIRQQQPTLHFSSITSVESPPVLPARRAAIRMLCTLAMGTVVEDTQGYEWRLVGATDANSSESKSLR